MNGRASIKAAYAILVAGTFAASAAQAGGDRVILYPAYGDARGTVIEGRVIESRGSEDVRSDDGKLRNFLRNARRFKNHEREHQDLSVGIGEHEWRTQTDDEGYLRLQLGAEAKIAPGWHKVSAISGSARAKGDVLIVAPTVTRGLISDLDDTILVTQVNDKPRMLRNTFLKNSAQRQAVPGMAQLYTNLATAWGETAPMIYLSASPRQLYAPIADFLQRNTFPRGILITKRVSLDRQGEPLTDQFAYKTAKIEEIFARLPGVRFVLAGDDGERDPEIYAWAQQRYPDRVEAVWIRHVNPDPTRARLAGQRDLAEVLAEHEEGRKP